MTWFYFSESKIYFLVNQVNKRVIQINKNLISVKVINEDVWALIIPKNKPFDAVRDLIHVFNL